MNPCGDSQGIPVMAAIMDVIARNEWKSATLTKTRDTT
jgi:hypothetical protein